MKLRIVSDLHLEFLEFGDYYNLPSLPDECDQVLVLAGDIAVAKKPQTYTKFLKEMSDRFSAVIYVLGNHEHYKGSIKNSAGKIASAINGLDNVHIANNRTVVIDDVSFICSTLWASMDNDNPLTRNAAKFAMNDYNIIRTGSRFAPYLRKLNPEDTYNEYIIAINYIFPEIIKEKSKGQKVVVVTHMAPSLRSIHIQHSGQELNGAYASDLDDMILQTNPDLMIHGHTHNTFDYYIGDTRVICNPRGYVTSNPSDLNYEYNPILDIDI